MTQTPTTPIDTLAAITVLFALVLALSLLIERALEVAKSLYDFWDCNTKKGKFWTARAHGLKKRLERRIRVFEYLPVERIQPIINRVNDLLLKKKTDYSGNSLVISGDLMRAAWIRAGTKIAGIILGIGLAFALKIDFLKLWQVPQGLPQNVLQYEPLAIIASGIAIGLGAGPVHKLITTLEKKQVNRQQKDEEKEDED